MKGKTTLAVAICLLTIMVSACHDKKQDVMEDVTFTDFPEVIELKGEGHVLDDRQAMLRYPFRIHAYGDYLFIFDMHNADEFGHIYDKKTFSHIASFGKRGEGPQEMLRGQTMRVVSLDSIWTLDPGKRQIARWRFLPVERRVEQAEVIRLDKQTIISARDIALYNDTTWFMPDLSGQSRVWHVGRNGKLVGQTGKIPTHHTVKEYSLAPLAAAWNAYIHYHPGNGTLVAATQLGDVMEIYRLQENKRKAIRGPHGEPVFHTTPQGYAVPTGIMGYSDVQITDSFIYTVFHGRTFKEIAADPTGTEDGGRYLRVFDLEGNPVRCYHLDHAIYGIHVDEKEGFFWATDVNTEEQVVRYPLSSSGGAETPSASKSYMSSNDKSFSSI